MRQVRKSYFTIPIAIRWIVLGVVLIGIGVFVDSLHEPVVTISGIAMIGALTIAFIAVELMHGKLTQTGVR